MRRDANTCHTGATVWRGGGGEIREDIREEREAKKKKSQKEMKMNKLLNK